jgi:Immunity protein 63
MRSLSEIKTEVDRQAAVIGAAEHHALPTYGHTQDGARPHIEVDSRGYHLVVVERGQEQERFTTRDHDELLFRIFKSVTHELAFAYELAYRVETQDCRRLAFRRQVELLSQLSPRWAEREAQAHEHILRKHPFDDMSGIRAGLTKELRDAGHTPQTAWQMACERYPLPSPA